MFQPSTLDDVIGQDVWPLKNYVANCYDHPDIRRSACWLLSGKPGCGKTVTAQALAADLGCHDEMTGRWTVNCTELTVDAARDLFRSTLRLRWGSKSGMTVLILEEFEWVSDQCQRFLKTALDPHGNLPRNLCVVATSNDTEKLCDAVMDRFRELRFDSGKTFIRACQVWLGERWKAETGDDYLPTWFGKWGFKGDEFSMRAALRSLAEALAERKALVAA